MLIVESGANYFMPLMSAGPHVHYAIFRDSEVNNLDDAMSFPASGNWCGMMLVAEAIVPARSTTPTVFSTRGGLDTYAYTVNWGPYAHAGEDASSLIGWIHVTEISN
jgi:hypothetical protein